MSAFLPDANISGGITALLVTSDGPLNQTAASPAGHVLGQSLPPPLCTLCCCRVINRTLAVAFMVSLAFAIVVGNVVTLTVFVQTRQSRTPQGYLKGKFILYSPNLKTSLDFLCSPKKVGRLGCLFRMQLS